MKVFVTGATGFIGSAVINSLLRLGVSVTVMVRKLSSSFPEEVAQIEGALSDALAREIKIGLHGVDVVIHTAARVHIMDEDTNDPLAEFRKVNTAGTMTLAKQAADAGVKRFIFLSSIKVNGEYNRLGQPFREDDDFKPTDPYGLSKYEAEQGLLALAQETGMEVVIIRPPLVYGVGVKANFLSMMKWIKRGVPLPLGAIYNARSLIALDNLTHFIVHCLKHPKAKNEIFLVSDGDDVSTTELLYKVAKAFNKKVCLIPIPVWLMTFFAKFINKGDVASRLFSSLQVDNSKSRDLLRWKPVTSMDKQLKKIVESNV